jgi:hypothetical protein
VKTVSEAKSKTWEWIHRGGTLASYGTVLSFVGGAAVGVWAYVSQLPAPTIAVHGVVTAAALLGVVAALRTFFRRDPIDRKPTTEQLTKVPTDPSVSVHDLEANLKAALDESAKLTGALSKAREEVTQQKGLAEQWLAERNRLQEETESWRARLVFVGEELKKAEAERDDLRRLLSKEGTEHGIDLQEAKDQGRNWLWQFHYGVEYPSNIPDKTLDLYTLRSMRTRFDEHIGVCKEAAERTDAILRWVIGNMKDPHHLTAKDHLARFIEEYVQERLLNAFGLLDEDREDSRAPLVAFYARYAPARRWVMQGIPLVIDIDSKQGIDPYWATTISYREWLEADAALLADIKKLKNVRYLDPIMQHLPQELFIYHPIPLRPSAPPSDSRPEAPSARQGDLS